MNLITIIPTSPLREAYIEVIGGKLEYPKQPTHAVEDL